MSSKLIARSRNLCIAGFALLVISLIPDQLAAQRGGSDRGSSGQGRGGSGGGFQGRGGSTQGRGGSDRGSSTQGRGGSDRGSSTQGRGGSDRGSSTQGRGGSSGGMSDFISRMDTNGNGNLDPDEQGRLRPLLERISSARRDRGSSSLDLSRPIPISRLSDEMNRMRQQREQGGSSRGSSGGGSNLGRGDSGSLSRTDLPPLVPDFAFEDEVYIPLPSFGPEGERNTVSVTEADRKEAAQTMKRYDKNGDSILSKEEIAQARWRDDPLQQDRNRDGRLTVNELSLRYALRRNDNRDGGGSSNRSGSSRDSASRGGSSSRDSGGRGSSARGSSSSSSNSSSSGRDSGGRGSSTGGSSGTDRMAFFANSMMQRYDKNGSGVLEKDEWKEFRTDPSPGDTNKDGKLTKDELTKWMSSRFGQSRGGDSSSARSGRGSSGGDSGRGRFSGRGDSGGERSGRGDSGGERSGRGDSGGERSGRGDSGGSRSRPGSSTPDTPDSYRFKTVGERLPEGLPDWFKDNDADGDGQIMMAEYAKQWNAKMLDSFDKFDFDADGVITPQECLDGIDEGAKYGVESSSRSSRDDRSSSGGDSERGSDEKSSSASSDKSTSSSQYTRYLRTYDSNKDGVLEKEEWSKSKYIKEDFDQDGDGKLTLVELTKGFDRNKK
jgi:Ca2+-binding EF-hand superfamily protein